MNDRAAAGVLPPRPGTRHRSSAPFQQKPLGQIEKYLFQPYLHAGGNSYHETPGSCKTEKSLCGGFNTNQLRKLTNNANIQRLIAWWHYCNLHGSLKGIIHHLANSGQLAECMEKYQKRNECPEWGIEKIWNFLPPSHFLSFTELGNVQSLFDVHKVQIPILHTRLIPAPCVLILHLWGGGRSVSYQGRSQRQAKESPRDAFGCSCFGQKEAS